MELIKKDATTTRFYKDKHGETNRILSEDEVQALQHEQELATKKYRRNWLNQIEDETVPPVLLRARQFKDPELMFLTRPQRLRLEHIVNGSYLARQQEGATAGKPAATTVCAAAALGCAVPPAPFGTDTSNATSTPLA